MRKGVHCVAQELSLDLTLAQAKPSLLFDAKNIRLSVNDGNTLLSITQELGTRDLDVTFNGEVLGSCLLNDYLIVFYNDNDDNKARILICNLEDLKYAVDVSLSTIPISSIEITDYSWAGNIDAIAIYETDKIQKVYWTDGNDCLRFININDYLNNSTYTISINKINSTITTYNNSNVQITVSKKAQNTGTFSSGVIQWALSYIDEKGSLSKIFAMTPITYIDKDGIAGAPDEACDCCFSLKIENLNTEYKRLRVYRILRSSLNSAPQVWYLPDYVYENNGPVYVYDDGRFGTTITPTDIYFIGGDKFASRTLTQKDNVLFMGNLQTNEFEIGNETIVENLGKYLTVTQVMSERNIPSELKIDGYSWKSLLQSPLNKITYYKAGETYRIGYQVKDKYGRWSNVICNRNQGTGFVENITILRKLNDTYFYPKANRYGGIESLPQLQLTINQDNVQSLINAGGVAVRAVAVFPESSDRSIVALGIMMPTLFNAVRRHDNVAYCQSDWFSRANRLFPIYWQQKENRECKDLRLTSLEDRHNRRLPLALAINAELACMNRRWIANADSDQSVTSRVFDGVSDVDGDAGELESGSFYDYPEIFAVDKNVCTFYSPEVEFSDELADNSFDDCKVRFVGFAPVSGSLSRRYVDIDKLDGTKLRHATALSRNIQFGFSSLSNYNYINGYKRCTEDCLEIESSVEGVPTINIPIYPWNGSGSLSSSLKEYNVLNTTILLNCTICLPTQYKIIADNEDIYKNQVIRFVEQQSDSIYDITQKITTYNTGTMQPLNRQSLSVSRYYLPKTSMLVVNDYQRRIRIPSGVTMPGVSYASVREFNTFSDDGYGSGTISGLSDTSQSYFSAGSQGENINTNGTHILYSSGRHLVVAFDYAILGSKAYQVIMPTIVPKSSVGNTAWSNALKLKIIGNEPFWETNCGLPDGTGNFGYAYERIKTNIPNTDDMSFVNYSESYPQDNSLNSNVTNYFWIAEIYRNVDLNTKFGGTSEAALKNNKWIPVSDEVRLVSGNAANITTNVGDTYFQRYDHLKTFPQGQGNVNNVVDYISAMVETHVNIDGRYDKYRGNTIDLYPTPNDINKLNSAYSLTDNIFEYKIKNFNVKNNNIFPSQVAWSMKKSFGEDVDSWGNISLSSVLDLDGGKGPINALRKWNDKILFWQDKGFGTINYNDRVSISVSSGAPIQIANSGKVEGKTYLSEVIGCEDYRLIDQTATAIYWANNNTKEIYRLSNGIESLGAKHGMKQWITDNNIISTYSDKLNGDVYFSNDGRSLCFSEQLNAFESFFDYDKICAMPNIGDKTLVINTLILGEDNYFGELHQLWNGPYGQFFSVKRPSYVTYRINGSDSSDKIWDTFTYHGFKKLREKERGGTYIPVEYTETYGYSNSEHYSPINAVRFYNEYQDTGEYDMSKIVLANNVSVSLKSKFRQWSGIIPRDNDTQIAGKIKDRIRSPYLYMRAFIQPQLHCEFTITPTSSSGTYSIKITRTTHMMPSDGGYVSSRVKEDQISNSSLSNLASTMLGQLTDSFTKCTASYDGTKISVSITPKEDRTLNGVSISNLANLSVNSNAPEVIDDNRHDKQSIIYDMDIYYTS